MEDIKNKIVKTGTTTVGVVCKDGIVLAADKRATLGGQLVGHKKIQKIIKLNDDLAITTAGMVSDVQLLAKVMKAQLRLDAMRRDRRTTVKEAANLLSGLVYQNIRKFSAVPGITGFLMGGRDEDGFHLYDIGVDGSALKDEEYLADGSGMMFALGVLETEYKPNMSVEEGVKVAAKAVNASIQRDTATGNGIDVYTITDEGVKHVMRQEIDMRLKI